MGIFRNDEDGTQSDGDDSGSEEGTRVLPLLPLRDIVVFPYMVVPLFVGRAKSICALEEAMGHERELLLCAQREASEDEPGEDDIYRVGTLGSIIQLLRLPVVATLDALAEDALVDILTTPKNALVKQYQKLFEFEEVRLRFSDGALRAVARQAVARKSGARGLRSILETVMLDLMYDIPSRDDVEECVIGEEVIEQGAEPLLVYKQEAESA